MKIFVAYGYNDHDDWIRTLVIRFLGHLDVEVITGRSIYDGSIDDEVRKLIGSSDGLIAFSTRRDNTNETHEWVQNELKEAKKQKKFFVEIVEKGVDPVSFIGQDPQYETIDKTQPNYREELLVKIAEIIKIWKKLHANKNLKTSTQQSKRLHLMPQEIAEALRKDIYNEEISCTYSFLNDTHSINKNKIEYSTEIIPLGNTLAIDIENIPDPNAYVKIKIKGSTSDWQSDYLPINQTHIKLEKHK